MKFCQPHWDQLREAIKARGMFHLVANSGEEAANRLKKQADGQAVVPDPLMEAHMMILQRAISFMPHIIGINEDAEDKHYCPLCEARKHMPPHPETKVVCDESWIQTLTEHLQIEYTKEGWLKSN